MRFSPAIRALMFRAGAVMFFAWQHDRSTRADRELEERVSTYTRGVPNVRHLIHICPDS